MSEICQESIFSSFFKNHVVSLRNYLIYKFGQTDQADDLVQDAFIKLWQNCTDVPLEKAKSYLYTLVNNASLNLIAHEKVKLRYNETQAQVTIENKSPEFILEEEQFKNQLLTAIERLNEPQRIAFLMHRIDGKKYSEIAEILNISVKAVEKRIHLALNELRKEFKNFK